MNYKMSLFPASGIKNMSRYGGDEEGPAETARHVVFSLNGQDLMCIDSYVKHGFTFTPSMSLYVTCETERELDMLFAELSEGGMVPMPLDAYPFSKSYAWVNDRFGVSWQLGLGNILK